MLKRIYGAEALSNHDYSRTLSSLAFAGTIVGMLTFGTSQTLPIQFSAKTIVQAISLIRLVGSLEW